MTTLPFTKGDKVRLKHFPAVYFTIAAVQAHPEDLGGFYTGLTGLQKPISAYGNELELIPEPVQTGSPHPKGAVLGFRAGTEERFTVKEYDPLPLSRGGVYAGPSTSREADCWGYGDAVVLQSAEPPLPPLTAALVVEALAKPGEFDGFRIDTADLATGSGRRAISGVDAAGRGFVAYVTVANLKYTS